MKLKNLANRLFGRRFYAVVVSRRGTSDVELTSAVHPTLAEAMLHAASIRQGLSFDVVGIVSFRSHLDLC